MRLALVLLVLGVLGSRQASSPPPAGDYIKVEILGTLRTGLVAIGGETTGTMVTARGARWELDLSRWPGGPAAAQSLDGRRVVVKGSLEVRPGVERRERAIVTVTSLEPAPPASPAATR
jgi:hypothetical protein